MPMPVPMRKERLQAKKAPDRRSDEIMRLPRGCEGEGEGDRRAEKRIVAVLTTMSGHSPATERQRSTATLPAEYKKWTLLLPGAASDRQCSLGRTHLSRLSRQSVPTLAGNP